MSNLTPDDATIEAMAAVILRWHESDAYMEDCRDLSDGILAAIRLGEIPLPEDVPQIAALRARRAELEATDGMRRAHIANLERELHTTEGTESMLLEIARAAKILDDNLCAVGGCCHYMSADAERLHDALAKLPKETT